jgi:hypothetical protein
LPITRAIRCLPAIADNDLVEEAGLVGLTVSVSGAAAVMLS